MISRRQTMMLAPLGLAGLAGLAFWRMLDRMESGRFDPHSIGNPMLGKHIPDFTLPGVGGGQGFSSRELIQAAQDRPVLLNFFWSPCIPCAEEAATLAQVAQEGLPIWGLVWKDSAADVRKFLEKYGNPYARIADDTNGAVSIDFGVYGMPESFLIGRNGTVIWHCAGSMAEGTAYDDLHAAVKAAA